MAIRPATATDTEAVEALMRRARPTQAAADDTPALIEGGVVRVLTQDSAVVGVLVLINRPDHLLIDTVVVDPSRHGKGFEKAMLAFAEGEACNRGYDEVRLPASEGPTGIVMLCRSLGYWEMPRHDRDGDRLVLMRKAVS